MLIICLLSLIYCMILSLKLKYIQFVWLLFTFLLGGIYYLNNVIVNIIIYILLGILLIGSIIIHHQGKSIPTKQNKAMIILGYVLSNNTMQPLLYNRLETAYQYYLTHPDLLIIVTGGITRNNTMSEATLMKEYLVHKGINPDQIQIEDHSQTTYDNLINCEKYIGGFEENIILVTNQFHMSRALKIARHAGYKSIEGLVAPDNIEFIGNYIREVIATIIVFIQGRM